MKVLILSCNTGQGHNSVAQALRECLDQRQIPCTVTDVLQFISPQWSELISKGHSWIYCHVPQLFSWGYEKAEQKPGYLAERSVLYRFFSKGVPGLRALCVDGGYDVVLCVHVFAALMLSEAMREPGIEARTAFVSTDYTCSPGTLQSHLDHYFAPCAPVCAEFAGRSVSAAGIPVRQSFFRHMEPAEAKRLCGIGPDHRHILMMGGSMGCGPVEEIASLLAAQLPPRTELSIVCGTNKRLQQSLTEELGERSDVHIYGYTKDIPVLMDSAELYITKPGGISVTEAMVKGLPMVLLNAVEGCESYNLAYMTSLGGAVSGETPEAVAAACIELLGDEDRRMQMHAALCEVRGNAAERICDAICEMVPV